MKDWSNLNVFVYPSASLKKKKRLVKFYCVGLLLMPDEGLITLKCVGLLLTAEINDWSNSTWLVYLLMPEQGLIKFKRVRFSYQQAKKKRLIKFYWVGLFVNARERIDHIQMCWFFLSATKKKDWSNSTVSVY